MDVDIYDGYRQKNTYHRSISIEFKIYGSQYFLCAIRPKSMENKKVCTGSRCYRSQLPQAAKALVESRCCWCDVFILAAQHRHQILFGVGIGALVYLAA